MAVYGRGVRRWWMRGEGEGEGREKLIETRDSAAQRDAQQEAEQAASDLRLSPSCLLISSACFSFFYFSLKSPRTHFVGSNRCSSWIQVHSHKSSMAVIFMVTWVL